LSTQKRLCWGGVVMVAVISTALVLNREGVGFLGEESAWAGTTAQSAGKAPPLPKAGPLANARSAQQVGFPVELTRSVTPADNPQTPEKIALGQKLFFEGRLSADGSVACATCHDPARAFTDGRPASIGIHGRTGSGTPRPF
jgi:cytochrome c peroxidase